MSKTHRIALGIEYIGTSFNGFQKQKRTRNTIQQNIESALSKVAYFVFACLSPILFAAE